VVFVGVELNYGRGGRALKHFNLVLAIRRERSRVIFFLEQFQEVSVDH
jgi:hypothetical protein